jgi:uncharacterized protein
MPVAPTFPGVYIEEVPSGVRTIVGVATSIAAFIDFFPRGLLNEAVRLLSFADFEREFGGIDTRSEASYAIQQFFLNGGTEAWVVRVADGAFATAAALLEAANGDDVLNVRAGRRIRGASALNPGVWANALRLEVDYDTTEPDEFFNLTVLETELRNGRTFVRQTETFRNLTMRPSVPENASEVVNERSRLVQLDRDTLPALPAVPAPPAPYTFRPAATGTLGGALPVNPAPAAIPDDGDTFTIAIDPDGPGATAAFNVVVTIDYGTSPKPTSFAILRPFLEASIRAANANEPLVSGLTVQLVNNRYRVLLGRTGQNFDPRATATFVTNATADLLFLTAGQGATVGPQQVSLAGGNDGGLPGSSAIRGARSAKTGMYALEDVDLFNILCIPRAAGTGVSGNDMRQIYAEAEAYCEEKRSFLIVDIPEAVNDLDDIQTWITENESLRHRNAAVYFPRVRIADQLNQGRLRSVGVSGTMAGLYAATDAARGVWKAPAGIDVRLRNVQDLDYKMTDRENGVINPLGINALRNFPVIGNVSWGARTLDGADVLTSEWKYIPVRRLALFLEESLYRGTKFAVFEPNDEPLWAQIRLNVGAFMQNLFRQGAFQGSTPRDAYFVKCDKDTTTQNDINLGIVNVVVGFAPLKPAEFVILRIQQMAGQIAT